MTSAVRDENLAAAMAAEVPADQVPLSTRVAVLLAVRRSAAELRVAFPTIRWFGAAESEFAGHAVPSEHTIWIRSTLDEHEGAVTAGHEVAHLADPVESEANVERLGQAVAERIDMPAAGDVFGAVDAIAGAVGLRSSAEVLGDLDVERHVERRQTAERVEAIRRLVASVRSARRKQAESGRTYRWALQTGSVDAAAVYTEVREWRHAAEEREAALLELCCFDRELMAEVLR